MNIFDLHNDIITSELTEYELKNRVNGELSNNNKIIYAIWTTLLNTDEFVTKCEYIKKNNMMSAVEDCGFIKDDFEIALMANPLYCSLTWNYDNELGGGACGESGLTEKGKKFIEYLNKHDIALDISHLNEKTFWQAIDIADRVLASHSDLYELKEHERNLNYRQIEAIIKKDGVIGLTPVPSFVNNGYEGYIGAINCFIEKFGNDNISIGSDFYGSKGIAGLRNYNELNQAISSLIADKNILKKILFDNAARFFGTKQSLFDKNM